MEESLQSTETADEFGQTNGTVYRVYGRRMDPHETRENEPLSDKRPFTYSVSACNLCYSLVCFVYFVVSTAFFRFNAFNPFNQPLRYSTRTR